jgi:hypothetical protein
MTRINLVDPKLLHSKHLVAEYRELPRIYALVRSAISRGEDVGTARFLSSPTYTLGAGHCRFFYPRLGWLSDRYASLIEEMRKRGFQTNFQGPPDWAATEIGREWYGAWEPTPACVRLNVDRINERLRGMGLTESQIKL